MGKLVYITGIKSSGKSTLADDLLKEFPKLKLVKTHITRPPREPNEEGHIFVSDSGFTGMVSSGVIDVSAQVPGEEYRTGLDYSQIDNLTTEGNVPLIVTRTPEIVRAVQRRYPDSLGIFLDIEPITAVDRTLYRDGYGGSLLRTYYLAKHASSELMNLRRWDDLVMHGDTKFEGPNLIIADRPPKEISKEAIPLVSEYLRGAKKRTPRR